MVEWHELWRRWSDTQVHRRLVHCSCDFLVRITTQANFSYTGRTGTRVAAKIKPIGLNDGYAVLTTNDSQDGDACKGDTALQKYCGECAILSASSYPTGMTKVGVAVEVWFVQFVFFWSPQWVTYFPAEIFMSSYILCHLTMTSNLVLYKYLAIASHAIISQLSEVKFLDLIKTDYCESICQGCFHWSRTKVRKSKTIRYRPSLNHKPCRLETGGRSLHASFSTLWEMKVFGLRGEYGRKAET